MIPSSSINFESLTIENQPTHTYKYNFESAVIRGYADELDAMKQAIFKILQTERYQYIMYSWNYGIETLDLYGEPISYVCPELKRRVTEALTQDDRINSVDDFKFEMPKKGVIHVSFIVHTIFGDIEGEKEVNF